MADCTIVGIRARADKYWYSLPGGNLGNSVDDSDTWGVNDGKNFWGGNINPCISSPSGNNKYTVCIKITTPNLSNVTISSMTITCRLFNHSQKSATSYPLYASLRTTSASDSSDTTSTFRTSSIGSEASTSTITGNELNVQTWSPTFYGNFSPNTSYYLFLYTKSTEIVYGAYMSGEICSGASIAYTQNVATYTVSLSKDSGIASVSGGGTYESGDSVSISATPSTGYKFVNWTGYGTSTSNPLTFTIGQNRTYTANSTRLTYTVSYNAGTYGSGTNTSDIKTYGTALTLKGAIFSRSGYTQTGWASDAAGTTLAYTLNGSYSTESNITLYPYWERNIYTLTINPNGGAIINGSLMTSEDVNVWSTSSFTTDFAYNVKTFIGNLTPGGNYHYDHRPAKTGYTFSQYTFSPGGTGQINITGETFYFMGESPEAAGSTANNTATYIFNGDYAGDVTATANYNANTYKIKYDSNGGTGTMAETDCTYDTISNLRKNTFTRSGYSFTGWKDDADTSYADEQSIKNLTSVNGGEVTLYAQWGQGTYQVTFDMNGGEVESGDFSVKTYNSGTSYDLPTGTLKKANSIFLGWSKTASATTATYTDGAAVTDLGAAGETIILYAIWQYKVIKIIYNSNNGASQTQEVSYDFTNKNSYLTLPSGWTKTGSTAVGWSTSTSGVAEYSFGQAMNSDMGLNNNGTINLYVKWTEKSPWVLTVINLRSGDTWYTI